MFSKILVPVDLEQQRASMTLLETALRFADRPSSAIHVMTVMPGYSMPIVAAHFPAEAKATARQALEDKLREFVAGCLGERKFTCSVSEGRRAEEILKVAKRRKSDLVLVGGFPHRRLKDTLLGSCGTKVAQEASCSVLVIRD